MADLVNILMIEDDEDLRYSLKSILEERTDQLHEAPSLEEAIKLVDQNFYSIIFLDLQLSDGSGVKVIEHLEKDPGHLNFSSPIVVLSGAMDLNYMRSYGRRVAKSINKPFETKTIESICEELLPKR